MTRTSDLEADLEAGLAHHEAGRIAEAQALYRKVLVSDPNHAEALNLLAVILQDAGDLVQSIELLSRAVAADPAFPEAFANLARAQSAAGDPMGAKRSSQQAIALDPELVEAYLQLARALLELQDNAAAATAATHAVALDPTSPDAQRFLGHALIRLKDYPAAEAAYRASDQLAPDRYETLLNLGMVLAELKQFQDALRFCRRAVELEPEDPKAHANLGAALRRAEDFPASVEALGRALALDPGNPVVWRQQGDNLVVLGRFDAAADCYRRVLALDPASSEALSCLATISRLTNPDGEKARLETAFFDSDRSGIERLAAGFALGGLLDKAGDYDTAFAIYAAANRLAREASPAAEAGFERAQFRGRIEQLRAAFVPATFEATRGWGDPSEAPVFIVGMPRSGTTLIEQILASHPDVYGAGERRDIPDIIQLLEAGQPALVPANWDPALVRHEAEAQRARLQAIGGSAVRVIDKLPDNILLLGHIAVLFPNARIIMARRDLRDVCLSCYFQMFRDNVDWAYDLADCAERACEIERLTAHWRAVLPLRMLELDYETLVGDLEHESRRLIDFLGLDWNESCLRFQATERVVQTASFWQVRQPLYASSAGRWRHYRQHIGPLLGGLIGVVPAEHNDIALPDILAGARAHRQAGRNHAAETAYGLVIERQPDNVEALHALGRLTRIRGDAPLAASLLRRAVAIRPDDAALLVELSRIYRVMADFPASAEMARQAVDMDPADAAARFLLGSALLDLDDPIGARAPLQRAVELAPDSRDAQLFFAMACMRLKQHETAAAALEQAVRLNPDDVEALAKWGRILGELGRHGEALPPLRRAVELAPRDGRVHLALVSVLWLANTVAAAAAACERGLVVAPDLAELWRHDGLCKAALGRFSEAQDSFRKALAIDPELDLARVELARIGLDADGELGVARLHGVLQDPRKEASERIGAGHALAEVLDRAGDYDGAWAAFDAANRLTRASHQAAGRTFDAAAFDAHVDQLIARFPRDFFATAATLGDPSDLPVFVVGMPRSGTTLVEQIASSHPAVFGAGELDDIRTAALRLDAETADLPSIASAPAAIAREAAAYLRKLGDLGDGARRVIDKMPDNFQWLGHIALLFPRARIVICRRDYRDIALSCYSQHFGNNLPWTADLIAVAARAQAFDRLLSHWCAVLPLSILEVQYEDLVQNLESESRRLIGFLGLNWNPACLTFHQTERTVMTASQWQVRQPLFTSSVGRWRNYRRHLRPLLTGLAGLVPSEGDEDWDALASEPATALILAVGHHRAGRLDYADAIYRALLRRNPDDPATLHLLGLLCCHRGEPADAVALISRSLALRPDVAPVLADLARALCATGDAPAAIDAAHRALELEPNSPEALLQLGCGLRLQQDAAGAVEVLRRAIELAPRSLEAWVAFAAASTDRKDHKTAELAWQAALELQPDDPGLLQEHAKSLMELKHFDAALAVFRKVDAAVPGQSAARYGMAGALVGSGQISAAADICRQVLEAVPDAMFWLLLANCEAMLGHFDAAADAYRSALALDPRAAGALHDLAVLSRRQDDDVASQAARIVLADPSRSIRDRVAAGFTLGQVYDRQGAYDAAFEAYADANRLLRNDRISQGFLFDRNNFSALVDRQIALIGPQTFVATANWGDPSDVPVFVVGMPRSGTSLVEQIAASHKSVFGAGERTELFGILGNLDGDKTECPPEAWERSAARREATAYVQKLRELGGDAARVIDKQPDNILCLGQIAVLFPRARVVVCRRDLRDVGLSCFFQYFRDDPLVWTDDLADCAFRAREIERLMDHWRQVLPISILEIQYETLVGNLEAESRRLIDFLGLAWDPACLSFHETERAVATASHWQVRQPLYASSAGRWRHYRRHLGPLLRELEGLVPADDGDP